MKLFKKKTINKVVMLPVDQITPNPAQQRKNLSKSQLKRLAESVHQNGILQPLIVRRNEKDTYELVCGERRLMAAKLVNKKRIPCIVVEIDAKQSAIYAFLENDQREDLHFLEEAQALQDLTVEWNLTKEEVQTRLGFEESEFTQKTRVLRLLPKHKQKILEQGLTEKHAQTILKTKDSEKIDEIIEHIAKNGLNAKQSEEYIEQNREKKVIPVIKDVRLFINTINRAVDMMQEAGVEARTEKIEKEDCIEYMVKIPR